MSKKNHTTKAACYIRMSTDDQENSPERQRSDLTKFAERSGYEIVEWYEDHGISGTSTKDRVAFQQMEEDATNGSFDIILACEFSRLSREDPLDAMVRFKRMTADGVRVQTIDGKFLDFSDLGGILTAFIGTHGAHDESRKISSRVTSGMRKQVEKGRRPFGGCPFGYAKELRNSSGQVERTVLYEESFRKPSDWSQQLVLDPRPERVEAFRKIYRGIINGVPFETLRDELNESGIRTKWGNHFSYQNLRRMLKNPVYKGTLVCNHSLRAKFSCIVDKADGQVVIENAHEPLVSPEVFDQAVKILSTGPARTKRWKRPLTGFLLCPGCGMGMFTHYSTRKHDDKLFPQYACVTPKEKRKAQCGFTISAPAIERAMLRLLAGAFLDPDIMDHAMQVHDIQNGDSATLKDAEGLQELLDRIDRVEENFTLAESAEELNVFRRQLTKLRDERDEVSVRLRRRRVARKKQSVMGDAFRKLVSDPSRIYRGNPDLVRTIIGSLIESIHPQRRKTGNFWDFNQRSLKCVVKLREEIWDRSEFTLTNLDLGIFNSFELVLRAMPIDGERLNASEITNRMDIKIHPKHLSQVMTKLQRKEAVAGHGNTVSRKYSLTDYGSRVASRLQSKSYIALPVSAADTESPAVSREEAQFLK